MKLVLSIFLFVLASGLTAFLAPVAIAFSLVKGIIRRRLADWYKSTGDYFFTMAFALDQFGNVLLAPLLNTCLIKSSQKNLQFGSPVETISKCLGKNQLKNNLSWAGELIVDFLDWVDPGHSIKAANSGTTYNWERFKSNR